MRTTSVRFVLDAAVVDGKASYQTVSEVEVYTPAATDSSLADLATLRIDGEPVEGFSAGDHEYRARYRGATPPAVFAAAVDEKAAVSVEQATRKRPFATVTVTAADGLHTARYRVAFDRR